MSTKTATIDTNSKGEIIAQDADGNLIASKRRTNNPAALAQVISAAEIAGFQIDWEESTVAQPDKPVEFRFSTDSTSGSVKAADLSEAYASLRKKITAEQVADGATLWVEDPATGERMTMGKDGVL